ncbi:MAG: ABC transporter ATP-binding protein, partial [Cyanobacteria bacterium P01_G01_bin.49]
MNNIVLDVSNLHVEFPIPGKSKSKVAVDGISFELHRGEILGIVGESGSGKSVTSLAIMGLLQNLETIAGTITFYPLQQNKPVILSQLKEQKWTKYRGKEIAMIFQEPMSSFNPVYTIGYQLIEAIKLHQKITPEQAKLQAITLLQEVKVLASDQQLEEEYLSKRQIDQDQIEKGTGEQVKAYISQQKEAYLKRYPHEVSGGQLQRVMIAMAISCNPTILIADEPTTSLDVTVQKGILQLLRNLCQEKEMSLIFISHDLGVINEVADRILVMNQGKIVEDGNKQQILYSPQDPYTKGLLACRPPLHIKLDRLPTIADFKNKEDTDNKDQKIVKNDTLNLLKEVNDKSVLLSVESLTVEFGKPGIFGLNKDVFKAVNDITFEVYTGETLGLVGESGCGKSTLARTILRLIPEKKGYIQFNGYSISRNSMGNKFLRNIRKSMQIVFQNPYNSLNPRLTVGQAIVEPMIIHKTQQNKKRRKEIVEEWLELVGLDKNCFNRYPHEFSGGQRQRICIARALVLNPSFLICDESVSALDVSVQAQVLNLLKDLQRKFNLTYLF